jgi:hypothetical protein
MFQLIAEHGEPTKQRNCKRNAFTALPLPITICPYLYINIYISLYIYIYIYMKIDKDVEVEQARDPRKMIEHILRCLETRRVLIG